MSTLSLLHGDNIKLFENFYILNPKLSDINKIGIENYNSYVSALCRTVEDVGDILWFNFKIWYEDIDEYTLFLSFYNNDKNLQNALRWFTGLDFILMKDKKTNMMCLYNQDNDLYMGKDLFMFLVSNLRIINYYPTKKEFNPANRSTKEYILRMKNEDRQFVNKTKIDLASISSYVAWKGKVGLKEIWDYTVYQIYDGYFRLKGISNFDHIMQGIYSGNVNAKDIDMEKINDANIILV